MGGDSATKIWKALTEDIKKRTWFKYYRGIEDFVIEAVRRSIENWEKCALAYETGEDSDAKVKAIENPRSGSTAPAKKEETKISQDTKLSGCSRYLGYLMKEHPQKTPLPDECLTCKKINECLMRAQ